MRPAGGFLPKAKMRVRRRGGAASIVIVAMLRPRRVAMLVIWVSPKVIMLQRYAGQGAPALGIAGDHRFSHSYW